jgi:hypothetical protein
MSESLFAGLAKRFQEAPMARFFGNCLRIMGAGALVSVAFLFGSLDPFLRATPLTSAAVSDGISPGSVNRDRKGDRSPLFKSSDNSGPSRTGYVIRWDLRGLNGSQAHRHVPVGCDPAFSPITSPPLAVVYGRCMT